MIKIDRKDLEILYQLDLNSRQSLKSIGKKVFLKKNVVQYRIDKLIKKGVIKNFYTSINFRKLGYINIGVDISYQYYTPKIENEIIEYFSSNDYSWFISNVQGYYDLLVLFSVKNMNQFFNFWKKTMMKYRYNIKNANILFFSHTRYFPAAYLIEDKSNIDYQKFEISDGGVQINIDNIDYNILRRISLNSRKQLTEIARELDISSTTIVKRIKKLEKNRIINGYRVNIDYSKLNLQLFNVRFSLKRYENIPHIIEYAKTSPNIISISDIIGNWDLSLNYYIKNYNDLHNIICNILDRFPNDFKNRMTFCYPEIYKSNYMPNLKI
jgi:Lrp/AsnC family leucine-responsive transcriptional regulator